MDAPIESAPCPKCGASATDQTACARCGLRVDRWASFDGAPVPDPLLDEAFAQLRDRWEDLTAHDSFLSLARSAGVLDGAAARYRQVLRASAGDVPAQRSLTQIVLLAAHQQDSAPREGAAAFRGVYAFAVVVAVALVGMVGLMLVRVLRH